MLDLRNLKAAVLGIMRRARASQFNGTKMRRSVKCVFAMAMLPLTLHQLAGTRHSCCSSFSLVDDFTVLFLFFKKKEEAQLLMNETTLATIFMQFEQRHHSHLANRTG